MKSCVVVLAVLLGTSLASARSRTIYLNRNGVTVRPGANDASTNRSSLVTAERSIPRWETTDVMWSETVTCLREMFAPFAVELVETDPGDVPHIEAVFGGTAAMLGFQVAAGGVAPFSTTCRLIESSMVFTFTDTLPASSKVVCEVMAQEIAHTYGLDHVLLASDAMTYLSYADKRAFQDEEADCGETSPRPCGAPGYPSCRARQNSYQVLLERLGPAGAHDEDDEDDDDDAADGSAPPDTAVDDPPVDDPNLGCAATTGGGYALPVLALLLAPLRSRRARPRGSR
jgi:uncharacterized protein (TIGR03382 family)